MESGEAEGKGVGGEGLTGGGSTDEEFGWGVFEGGELWGEWGGKDRYGGAEGDMIG